MELTLVTHDEIVINAAPDRVWTFILEPNEWKRGAKLEHVYGPRGGRGEGFAAVPAGSQDALYYVEDVEFVPQVRRTLKLLLRREGPLLGFATWGLRENSGRTTVTYDVYAQYSLTPEVGSLSNADEREAFEVQYATAHSARFREELQDLKRLAESGEIAGSRAAKAGEGQTFSLRARSESCD